MIVLDTNTVSALMRGDARAKERLLGHRRSVVGIPQPVVAEIEYGLARLSESRRRTRLLQRWQVVSRELRRVDWTDAVSEIFGRVKTELESQGCPIDDFDLAIAAHAMANEAVLVTNNLFHFGRITDLALEDWLR